MAWCSKKPTTTESCKRCGTALPAGSYAYASRAGWRCHECYTAVTFHGAPESAPAPAPVVAPVVAPVAAPAERRNSYPGRCSHCGCTVAAGAGFLTRRVGNDINPWSVRHADAARCELTRASNSDLAAHLYVHDAATRSAE